MKKNNKSLSKISVPFSTKGLSNEGYFSGYASVFNVADQHKDIILSGAFEKTLKSKKDIKLLWQHNFSEPIGIIEEIYEDAIGLFIKAKLLLDVQKGKESYSLMKSGAVDGLSIGFSVIESHYDAKTKCRILSEIELWEVSLVTFPANEEATISEIKGMIQSGELIKLQDAIDNAVNVLSSY